MTYNQRQRGFMFYTPGAPAITHFRIERLLAQICYVVPQVTDLYAEFIHFIDTDQILTEHENDILESLLDYGQLKDLAAKRDPSGTFLLVIPRPGTVSPWSSKATDILHYCHLQSIRRIERGTAFYIEANEKITWGDLQAIADILHDRMTETVIYDMEEAKSLFERPLPQPLETIPLLKDKRAALHVLQEANLNLGLALSEEELHYLLTSYQTLNRDPTDVELMMFAQLNSEHCRHKIFNAQWIIDGVFKSQSLLSMIKNTYKINSRGILSAYQDNAAIIVGGEAAWFYTDPNTHIYKVNHELTHCILKVETHNHPTGISPYQGAASGVGGEIRDEAASGRGGKTKAGMVGFCVSNLEIPGFIQPFEFSYGRPKRLSSALDIMLEAPIGAAEFGNEFGRPTLLGFFRTFEQRVLSDLSSQQNTASVNMTSHTDYHAEAIVTEVVRGYHKPLVITGGMGSIRHMNILKGVTIPGNLVIILGGPSMLMGVGGGAAASVVSSTNAETLDFASVQRSNADMQRRCQEVIDTCTSLGKDNPIITLHDVGAGGLANALSELVFHNHLGGNFELRDIPNIDPSLSPLELWCNEAQERIALVVAKDQFEKFKHIADREACPFAVVGEFIETPMVKCHDSLNNSMPVDLSTEFLFGNVPRVRQLAAHRSHPEVQFNIESINISEAVYRLLRLPCIADKSFLITINDRTVTGLVVRDSMVGPWQVPVADCAVTARDFIGYFGEAMAVGERPLIALINPIASARIAVAESITNIAAACIGVLSDIRLSANWAAASGFGDEDARLYDAVQAIGMELCPALNITIPAGKDSLSMQTIWEENDEIKQVVSPLSVVMTAFAPVMDVRRTLTPVLRKDSGETHLIFIDLARGQTRLGGSALAQVYGAVGTTTPDVEDPAIIKGFFAAIQQLNLEDKILAYHDRSDGGLFITLCEMAFASHTGLQIDLTGLGPEPISALFNEELGVVIQIHSEDVDAVLLQLNDMGLNECYVIGSIDESDELIFVFDEQVVFRSPRIELAKTWSEISYYMQVLRDNPRCARKELETINDQTDPGLTVSLTFDLKENVIQNYIKVIEKPRVAILREQGINGHMEMAAAFYAAGFSPIDVHMNDLKNGSKNLDSMVGLAVCGGFSFGDALGAGKGWAKRILFNEDLRSKFEIFFKRPDTFTLGISNGCQMLSELKTIIPGAEHWPNFVRNYSDQFEGRLCLVEIEPSPSIFLTDMAGSRIPVAVAHAVGRTEFLDEETQAYSLRHQLVTLRYVDSRGRKTNIYPANPNGSPLGITGLTTPDGRINIMMPHPERGFRAVQFSWHPKDWAEEGPWLRMFQNARRWVG